MITKLVDPGDDEPGGARDYDLHLWLSSRRATLDRMDIHTMAEAIKRWPLCNAAAHYEVVPFSTDPATGVRGYSQGCTQRYCCYAAPTQIGQHQPIGSAAGQTQFVLNPLQSPVDEYTDIIGVENDRWLDLDSPQKEQGGNDR